MKENSKPNLALHVISFCLVFVVGYTVAVVPFDVLPQSISIVSDAGRNLCIFNIELSLGNVKEVDTK